MRRQGQCHRKRCPAMPRVMCYICTGSKKRPNKTMCACKGDASFAHAECLVKFAQTQSKFGRQNVWYECGICKKFYTGEVRGRLAEAWLQHVSHLPDSNNVKNTARLNMMASLFQRNLFRETIQQAEQLLVIYRRSFWSFWRQDSEYTLHVQAYIAYALHALDEYESSISLLTLLFDKYKARFGVNSQRTLNVESELHLCTGTMLFKKGNYQDSIKQHQCGIEISYKTQDPDMPRIMRFRMIQALSYFRMHLYEKAVEVQNDVVAWYEQHLGEEHDDTWNSKDVLDGYKERDEILYHCDLGD